MTPHRSARSVLAALPLLTLAAGTALAQQPQIQLPPGTPPSIGQEIDRALSQVPRNIRPNAGAGTSVGQDLDRLLAQPAAPSSRQVTVGFTNRVALRALVVQFAAVDRPDWGPNRLGNERLNTNATMRWRVNEGGCRFDVRVTFEDGDEFVRLDHDFCAANTIEITDMSRPAEMPRRDAVALYTVINRSGEMVMTVRATPVGARTRNPDLLGSWVMAEGDHYTGRVARGGNCLYDIRAAFTVDERETLTLPRQDLCQSREIVIPRRTAPQG